MPWPTLRTRGCLRPSWLRPLGPSSVYSLVRTEALETGRIRPRSLSQSNMTREVIFRNCQHSHQLRQLAARHSHEGSSTDGRMSGVTRLICPIP